MMETSILKLIAFCLVLGVSLAQDVTCGGALSGSSGTVQSPNYPDRYPHNANCVWTITTEPGTQVRLTFSSFLLENSNNCSYDSLMLRDGNSNEAAMLGEPLCGAFLPFPVTSTSNVMYIEFKSDDVIRASGFQALWSTV
ncbi:Tolloid-like protein 1 [Elysia marginata]|uniref:Tolloid-like protein 1 n=1 Tax=Elysia marginata TaxID=1093978 RepID=A0AAV4FE32_9GAST|nr:Tolloid-like protein 1 [Elysia marginata]